VGSFAASSLVILPSMLASLSFMISSGGGIWACRERCEETQGCEQVFVHWCSLRAVRNDDLGRILIVRSVNHAFNRPSVLEREYPWSSPGLAAGFQNNEMQAFPAWY
jgi:hypothetical protein